MSRGIIMRNYPVLTCWGAGMSWNWRAGVDWTELLILLFISLAFFCLISIAIIHWRAPFAAVHTSWDLYSTSSQILCILGRQQSESSRWQWRLQIYCWSCQKSLMYYEEWHLFLLKSCKTISSMSTQTPEMMIDCSVLITPRFICQSCKTEHKCLLLFGNNVLFVKGVIMKT